MSGPVDGTATRQRPAVLELAGADGAARCAAVAGLLRRSRAAATPVARGTPERALLSRLWSSGRLAYTPRDDGAVEVTHVPGAAALAGLGGEGPWEAVHKRQLKAVRTVPGALFRCPPEDPDGEDIELFITDWSPCPAACAVAIHPWHPFARATRRAGASYFTGRHVRHPLTGDLLAVWVAGWVRPEFGTGAVLVNPAHSEADLAFAREVGLPIRFALSHDPGVREQRPPVIGGTVIRTGEWDGLSAAEASSAYLARLVELGRAERVTLRSAPPGVLATLRRDGGGALAWCPACGWLDERVQDGCPVCAGQIERVALEPAPLLAAAAGDEPLVVVAAREQVEGQLLALRLLLAEVGEPERVEQVVAVQQLASAPEGAGQAAALAVLVAAAPGEQAVVRAQLLEQCERFLDTHGRLLAAAGAPGDGHDPGAAPAVKQAVRRLALPQAFKELYRWQKQLAERDALPADHPYFAAAAVLAGVAAPEGCDVGGTWEQM